MPDGVEGEYGAACGAEPGAIPLDLWESDRPVETRADAASPAPSTVGQMIHLIQPYVFAASIASRLGITMPTVGSGSHSWARVSTALTAGAKAKGAAAESTAAALTAVTASPRRISARLTIQAEDVAAIGTSTFEPALRSNLQGALTNAYDGQCIGGDGASPNVSGLMKQITAPTVPTSVVDWDGYLSAYAGLLDGLWAPTMRDVSIVAPVARVQTLGYDVPRQDDRRERQGGREPGRHVCGRLPHGAHWRMVERGPDAGSGVERRPCERRGVHRAANGPVAARGRAPGLGIDAGRRRVHRLGECDPPRDHARAGRRQGADRAAGRVRAGGVQGGVTVAGALTLLRGPAASGKSQVAAGMLDQGEADAWADFTRIHVALSGVERGPDGRYPVRADDDSLVPLAAYLRAVAVRAGLARGFRVVTTHVERRRGRG